MNAITASSVGDVGGQRQVDAGEVVAQVDADDGRALGAEQRGALGADPAGRAGDHADLALEPAAHARAASTSAAISRAVGSASGCHCTPSAKRARGVLERLRQLVDRRPARHLEARLRSRPRPDDGATWSRASARPRRGRPASRRPAARRGRRTRPARAGGPRGRRTSGRCSISVPPRARFISCIPRQTPSSGRSASSAASAERDLERVALRVSRRSRRRRRGSARPAAPATPTGRRSGSGGSSTASPPARWTAVA